MNKAFTEIQVPPKTRLIIRVHTTTELNPTHCESCHMSRVSFAEIGRPPLMCEVCGRMLCRACYGEDGTYTANNLKKYNICDECNDLEDVDIEAVLIIRQESTK
jgi:hypothetical protein